MPALVGTVVMFFGLLAAVPQAAAALADFVLRDQPSGQAAWDLTDFAYLPDGGVLTTGKSSERAGVAPDNRTRSLATQ